MITNSSTASGNLDTTDLQLLAILQANASISNIALADKLRISAPTCLRRTKRLLQEGWIEKQVAILSSDKLGRLLGHSVTALIEVSLDKQGEELLLAFETRAIQEAAVQQCWRVSPGPDFMLVVQVPDMPSYLSFTQKLLTQDANVRNVKAFFSLKRAKFGTQITLPLT
ncbi:MAG: Lrp/AsnC family transcriptional regulator [Betaproteobacteria bacterium]|jgi:DNA-binding Lrp family transcriptional regulator